MNKVTLSGMIVKGEPHFHVFSKTTKCEWHNRCKVSYYFSASSPDNDLRFCHQSHSSKPKSKRQLLREILQGAL